MAMGGNLSHRQRNAFNTTRFCEDKIVAMMQRQAAAQVWKSKGGLTISSVRRPNKGKEPIVLADGQDLAFAKHPAYRREVPGKNSNLSCKRHRLMPLLVRTREDALQRDAEGECEKRLHVQMCLAAASARH